MKIGLHTYSNKGEIYIVSWKMPVCRYFMFNDNAVEYTGSVYQSKLEERYQTHYLLKMKRRIDLNFDEVIDVTQMFPLTDEEEQIMNIFLVLKLQRGKVSLGRDSILRGTKILLVF